MSAKTQTVTWDSIWRNSSLEEIQKSKFLLPKNIIDILLNEPSKNIQPYEKINFLMGRKLIGNGKLYDWCCDHHFKDKKLPQIMGQYEMVDSLIERMVLNVLSPSSRPSPANMVDYIVAFKKDKQINITNGKHLVQGIDRKTYDLHFSLFDNALVLLKNNVEVCLNFKEGFNEILLLLAMSKKDINIIGLHSIKPETLDEIKQISLYNSHLFSVKEGFPSIYETYPRFAEMIKPFKVEWENHQVNTLYTKKEMGSKSKIRNHL